MRRFYAMLKINSLGYDIKQKPLLKEISFHLQKGENLTILGANGSGKSTLAKILCGLIPSEKKVLLAGEYIEKMVGAKRASYINYMPSKFSLYDPYITLKEYLNLSLYKETPKEKQLKKILSLLGLLKYQDNYAHELSSGEGQLLLLASTMMQSATITIFDEPTSNLDPKKTKLVFDVLEHSNMLKQKILITHDLQLAYRLNYPILYIEDTKATYFKEGFFKEETLKQYFDETIMIVDDNIVETL